MVWLGPGPTTLHPSLASMTEKHRLARLPES